MISGLVVKAFSGQECGDSGQALTAGVQGAVHSWMEDKWRISECVEISQHLYLFNNEEKEKNIHLLAVTVMVQAFRLIIQ